MAGRLLLFHCSMRQSACVQSWQQSREQGLRTFTEQQLMTNPVKASPPHDNTRVAPGSPEHLQASSESGLSSEPMSAADQLVPSEPDVSSDLAAEGDVQLEAVSGLDWMAEHEQAVADRALLDLTLVLDSEAEEEGGCVDLT